MPLSEVRKAGVVNLLRYAHTEDVFAFNSLRNLFIQPVEK